MIHTHTQPNSKVNLTLPRFPSHGALKVATSIFKGKKTQTYKEKLPLRNKFKFLFLNFICPTSSLLPVGKCRLLTISCPYPAPPHFPSQAPCLRGVTEADTGIPTEQTVWRTSWEASNKSVWKIKFSHLRKLDQSLANDLFNKGNKLPNSSPGMQYSPDICRM